MRNGSGSDGLTARRHANLKTLADHLGLSVTTVSRALKDGPEVRPDTIARVKEAAAALGYVPNVGGIHLRTGRTMKVCSILYAPEVGDYGDPGFLAQVESLSAGLEPSNYNLIVLAQTGRQTPLDAVQKVCGQRLADAVVFSRTTPLDERARYCLERGFPFATFGRTELLTPHAFVDQDDEGAVFDAVTRLAADGHRRIALVNPAGELTYLGYRLRGYRRGLAQAGLPWDPALSVSAELSVRATRETARRLLTADRSITALVCANQMSVVGVLEGLIGCGIDTVRDGLVVVGFGGMPFRMLSEQRVVYYYQPQRRVGDRLAEHVLALLAGDAPDTLATVFPYRRIDDLRRFREAEDGPEP